MNENIVIQKTFHNWQYFYRKINGKIPTIFPSKVDIWRDFSLQWWKDWSFLGSYFFQPCSIWLHGNNHLRWFNNKDDHLLCVDKHTDKLHVWAAISIFGKVNLFIFKENLNSARYSHILLIHLIPYANMPYKLN